jgi:hypothetical protein
LNRRISRGAIDEHFLRPDVQRSKEEADAQGGTA